MKKVFLIVGRTAAGKTVLSREVCKRLDLKLLKSYINRPMRDGETEENSDHTFINTEEIESYRDRMIAYTDKISDGYIRFATIDQLLDCDLYIIDPNGIDYLRTLKKKMPELQDVEFIEIYIRVPHMTIKDRAKQRKDNIDTFEKRYSGESSQFDYYENHQQFKYHVLNNGTVEDGVHKLESIIKKELEL